MRREKIVFLGDSLTDWGKWDELFPEKNISNFGVAGDTTEDILCRLNKVIEINPDKIFFMAGINDLGDGKNASETFESYKKIIFRIYESCSDAQIYLLSVLPINTRLFANTRLDEKEITVLNQLIQKLAIEKGFIFIDMYAGFADAEKQLQEELTIDGLHLRPEGYLLWKSFVKTYL